MDLKHFYMTTRQQGHRCGVRSLMHQTMQLCSVAASLRAAGKASHASRFTQAASDVKTEPTYRPLMISGAAPLKRIASVMLTAAVGRTHGCALCRARC